MEHWFQLAFKLERINRGKVNLSSIHELNRQKTDSLRILGTFSYAPLINRVQALKDSDWNQDEDFKLNYNKSGKALEQVKHLTLRFINRRKNPYEYLQSDRWHSWKDLLLPLMNEIVAEYGYQKAVFPKVMLANLPSGSFIPPHIDGDSSGYVPHKIHLPIITNNEAFFFLEDRKYHFELGSAYEVNNGLKHTVINHGQTNRVHLIFECLDYHLQPETTRHQMDGVLI